MKGSDLFGKVVAPLGQSDLRDEAYKARAYYNCNPYPTYGFVDWRTEISGPYPRCLSIVKSAINREANWLFGKEVHLDLKTDNKEVEDELNRIWKANAFQIKLRQIALKGMIDGSVAVKFTYDSEDPRKVYFKILSPIDEAFFYRDPHDYDRIIMVRVMYRIWDYESQSEMIYVEDWTDEKHIIYKLIKPGTKSLDLFKMTVKNKEFDLEIAKTEENKFRIIPIVLISNDPGQGKFINGEGNFFGLYQMLDRINLSYYLRDTSGQLIINPKTIYLNVKPKEGDQRNKPNTPGAVEDLVSVEGEDGPLKSEVKTLAQDTKAHDVLSTYAGQLTDIIYDTTGSVFPRQEHVTNKGSLTQSVLIQMYAPLLETIQNKRRTYGDEGIAKLFKTICVGLCNMAVEGFNSLKAETIYDIELIIKWFEQFKMSEDEKFALFDRIDRAFKGGYIDAKTAVEKIAELEELVLTDEEVAALVAELERIKELGEQQENATQTGNRAGNDPGGTEDGQRSRQQKAGVRVKDAN